jgi:hypothetical protein
MNLKNQIIALLAIPVLFLAACGNGTQKPVTLKSGITYQIIKKGKGTIVAKPEDVLSINVRAYCKDSMLFDSYKQNNNEPVPAQVMKPSFNGDVMEVIALMHAGDSVVATIQLILFSVKEACHHL